ncbi:hypothetical protein [Desulfurobacterium crinifex]
MKKILLLSLFTFHLSLFTPHSSLFTPTFASTQISRPPSTIHIKLPKPKSREEAIQRIPDYIILNMILPPVIDRENLKKELFGNYNKEIEKLINKKKIDMKKLTAIISQEMKKKDFSPQKLKEKLLVIISNSLTSSAKPVYDKEGVALGIFAAIVVALLSTLSLLIREQD